jgi:hypothetical protein
MHLKHLFKVTIVICLGKCNCLALFVQSAKYEFASSNTTRTMIAFDACFVWKIAPLADEQSGFFIESLSRRLTLSSTYLTLQNNCWQISNSKVINHELNI